MKKKLLILLFMLIPVIYAADIDIFDRDPKNPFDLNPPVWVQGYWESDYPRYWEIRSDSMISSFIGGSEENADIAYGIIDGLLLYKDIYSIDYFHDSEISQPMVRAKHIASCDPEFVNPTLRYYIGNERIILGMEEVVDLLENWLIEIGLTEDTPKELIIKCIEYAFLCPENADPELYNQEAAKQLIMELQTGNPSFEDLVNGIIRICFVQLSDIEKLFNRITVEEKIAYPEYSVTFSYDGFPFYKLSLTRRFDDLIVQHKMLSIYILDDIPEESPGVFVFPRDYLYDEGYFSKQIFHFREYSMESKAVR